MIRRRAQIFTAFLAAALLLTGSLAHAAVDLSTGLQHVEATGTLDDCSAKARTALGAYLQNVVSPSPGEWLATGVTASGMQRDVTASGTIHCYAHGSGYVVSFTCAVETPNNPYDAASLCQDLANNVMGKPETPLATPSPPPSGCNTVNLVGQWQDDNSSKTFKLDDSGGLTDSDDVIGSWTLNGLNAIITYYGNHNMTLSSDGKHLRGGGLSWTRKC